MQHTTTPILGNQQNSSWFDLSLEQRVFAAVGRAELFPVPLLPPLLFIQYQSIRNLIAKGEFPLPIVQFAGRNYVKTETLVRFLESCDRGETAPIRRKVGRKSNKERAETAQRTPGAGQ